LKFLYSYFWTLTRNPRDSLDPFFYVNNDVWSIFGFSLPNRSSSGNAVTPSPATFHDGFRFFPFHVPRCPQFIGDLFPLSSMDLSDTQTLTPTRLIFAPLYSSLLFSVFTLVDLPSFHPLVIKKASFFLFWVSCSCFYGVCC